jgi:hypothetical protein
MMSPVKPAAQEVSLRSGAESPIVNRWVAILYVALCFEMGLFLFVFPWVSIWHQNFFVARYLWLALLTRNYYLRGAVSGLGLVDIFLAFYELWRMRVPIGLVRSDPAR